MVWTDSNHDGVSQESELKRLRDVRIARTDLDYRRSQYVDPYGNSFHYQARVWDEGWRWTGRWAWDVYLSMAE